MLDSAPEGGWEGLSFLLFFLRRFFLRLDWAGIDAFVSLFGLNGEGPLLGDKREKKKKKKQADEMICKAGCHSLLDGATI